MARYSPPPAIIAGITPAVWMDFWRKTDNDVNVDYVPAVTDVGLSTNRSGIDNTAGLFNAATSEILFPQNSDFEGTSISFGGWFFVSSSAVDGRGIVYGSTVGSPFRSFLLIPRLAANSRAIIQVVTNTITRTLIVANPLPLDEWHHIAGVLRSGTLYGFLDGQLITSIAQSGSIIAGVSGLAMGYDPNFLRYFDGRMSEIFVFSEGLTADQVLELYNRFPVGKGSLQGNVFQKSGSSFSIRTRRSLLKRRSPSASLARSAFSGVKSNQQLMSGAQLNEFAINAPLFPRVNSLGQFYELSNQNLYSSQNIALGMEGEALNFDSVPPVIFPSPVIDVIAIEVEPVDMVLVLTPELVPADYIYSVMASDVLAQAPSNPDDQNFLVSDSVNAGNSTNINWGAAWLSRYGSSPDMDGKFVVMKLRQLHVPSGQSRFILTTVVQVGL